MKLLMVRQLVFIVRKKSVWLQYLGHHFSITTVAVTRPVTVHVLASGTVIATPINMVYVIEFLEDFWCDRRGAKMQSSSRLMVQMCSGCGLHLSTTTAMCSLEIASSVR